MEKLRECAENISQDIAKQLKDKMDWLITEGLKRKGFEFESRIELMAFVEENCVSYTINEKTYFLANGVCFLLYEKPSAIINTGYNDGNFTASMDMGSYSFL